MDQIPNGVNITFSIIFMNSDLSYFLHNRYVVIGSMYCIFSASRCALSDDAFLIARFF